MTQRFDVVVLAGGSGRRLGGVDKAGLLLAGLPLLDRVLLATAAAGRTVVVGSPRPTVRPVSWTSEEPPDGGPLAGLAAGVSRLASSPFEPNGREPSSREPSGHQPSGPGAVGLESAAPIVVLAVDLPWLTSDDVDRLVTALCVDPLVDAALFVDPAGRIQPLTGAYRAAPIRAALATVEPVHAKPVKLVLHQLAVVTVPDLGAAGDCDTPDQLAAARAHFDRQG